MDWRLIGTGLLVVVALCVAGRALWRRVRSRRAVARLKRTTPPASRAV